MEDKLKYYLNNFVKNKKIASEELIKEIERLDFGLPKDYIDLMKEFNGGEGEVGENGWLCLFPINELLIINKNYSLLMQQIPDYFLFGKDAADTGYAFHKRKGTIHSFGLMSKCTSTSRSSKTS